MKPLGIKNKAWLKNLVFFILGIIFTQILFGGWGNGIVNFFFNKPEIIAEQTIIFSKESPDLILMHGGMNPFGLTGLFITGIDVRETNSTHCLLSWLVSSDKLKNETISLRMDVTDKIGKLSYPEKCDGNKDCIQFSYSLESQNYKDIDNLYVEMCIGSGYSFLSKETNEYSDCIMLENDFVPMQKEIHDGIYIKVWDMDGKNMADYIEDKAEELYPTILVRDKNHKVLHPKEVKIIIQDILNCKVI